MSNFTFSHNVFKSHLLLLHQNASAGWKTSVFVLLYSHTGDGSDGDNYEKYTDSEWGNNEEKIRPSLLFNFRNKQPSQVTEKLASYLVVIFCKYMLCLLFTET